MQITPQTELVNRYQALQKLMVEKGMELALLVQNADLFYFTGSIQQGVLLIPCEGKPVYCVRKDLARAQAESQLEQIVALKSPRDLPTVLADHGIAMSQQMGMELDVVPVAVYRRFSKPFGDATIHDVTPLLRLVRMIKSDYELTLMRKAADQEEAIYQKARQIIRVGMTDLQVEAELEYAARLSGHQGITRMRVFNSEFYCGHVFSGSASSTPAFCDTPLGGPGVTPAVGQGAGSKVIGEQEPIIVDFLGAADGYLCDQTRTFCIGGLPDKLTKGYEDMRKVLQHMTEMAKPGASWGELYDSCYQLACDMGHKDAFMGAAGAQVSFIGHGVGTELDEFPFIARGFNDYRLEENMTFAFEPKLVYPELGAVGIENTYAVTANGVESLTYSSEELVIL
ncbi:MAG: aminopeptidase P family protein [Desulfuromonas sp.]|nr:aminopeptidase P family protein [Desulfuromonas sp.]